MAFLKSYSPAPGSKGTYWKIISIQCNLITEESDVILALYKDKKSADKLPHKFILTIAGKFKTTKQLLIKGNLLAFAYKELKLVTQEDGKEGKFFGAAKDV